MRIFSKFSDYYDSIQTFDKDDLLYLRKSKHIHDDPVIDKINYRVNDQPESSMYPLPFKKIAPIGYRSMILGFCGKLYPLVELHYKDKKATIISGTVKVVRFYVQHELDEFLLSMKMKIPEKQSYSRIYDLYKNYFSDFEKQIAEARPALQELFQMLGVPIYLIRREPEEKDWEWDKTDRSHYEVIIETNPCLRDLSFQKVFDPFMAFQEISMYLGGVLARPDRPMLTITDDVKAQQHGFDKHSFRAMKGDKKPRKSNRGKKT